jgi:hypothetical protein
VGTLDNFFLLGGDSLLAAHMLTVVSEATELDIPFSEFLCQGTVASLVQDIESQNAKGRTARPLVALRAEGSRPPLICIPGHDGILIGFSNLVRLLDSEQPLYVLEAPQPSAFPADAWNIGSFASCYADALVERFQNSPVHLAGICFGGVTAYEVARQLHQRGARVQSLILLDTLNPQWKEKLGAAARARALITMVCERTVAHARTLWKLRGKGDATYLMERARAFIAVRRVNANPGYGQASADPGFSKTSLLRRLAASNYRPGPYSGPIHMIRVRGLRPNPPQMGWACVASGKISIVEVDFCPRGMMADPAVVAVADLISKVIQ